MLDIASGLGNWRKQEKSDRLCIEPLDWNTGGETNHAYLVAVCNVALLLGVHRRSCSRDSREANAPLAPHRSSLRQSHCGCCSHSVVQWQH